MGAKRTLNKIATALVVLLFGTTGIMKISPAIYPPVYNELRQEFGHFVHIPPIHLLRLQPTTYMLIVGLIEVACVVTILVAKYRLGKLATWMLTMVMVGAIYTHYSMHHPVDKFVPAIVALSLLLVRLYTMGAFEQIEVKVKI